MSVFLVGLQNFYGMTMFDISVPVHQCHTEWSSGCASCTVTAV